MTTDAEDLKAGDRIILDVTIKDPAGDVIDLTGVMNIRWKMAYSVRSSDAILSKELGSGIVITTAEAGLIAITLTPEDTEDITGTFFHEVEVIDVGGNPTTVLQGSVTILPTLIHPV